MCLSISAGKGAGDHQILPVPGEARRLGVGAELCDHRAQQPLVQAALYRQRQLCPHVSASLGPLCPLQATLVSTRVQVVGTAVLGETGVRGDAGFDPERRLRGSSSTFAAMKRLSYVLEKDLGLFPSTVHICFLLSLF